MGGRASAGAPPTRFLHPPPREGGMEHGPLSILGSPGYMDQASQNLIHTWNLGLQVPFSSGRARTFLFRPFLYSSLQNP